jgi:starch synthase
MPPKKKAVSKPAKKTPAVAPELRANEAAVSRPAPIVHVVAELAPYARTGGLGEAVASLALFQAQAGIDVAVIMPLYKQITQEKFELRPFGAPFPVPIADRIEQGQLYEAVPRGNALQPRVIFVASDTYFGRDGIYGDADGDFRDNARRYAFFCLAALYAIPKLFEVPVVLHAHDWHAALAPVYLRSWFRNHPYFSRVATVLSVHNAGFQGHFPTSTMRDLGLPWELYHPFQLEWYGRVNLLKGGMAFSDVVTTVSPTHAQELRTPGGGFGLQEAFSALGGRFVGITNGIDTKVWDPTTDTQITATYSRDDLAGKAKCKSSLQRLFGLPQRSRLPLVGMSARMVYQKGLDLILGSGFLSLDAQFVFLGAGEAKYEKALSELAHAYPGKIGVQLNFTDRFGLTQMRAQRYGALPLARAVGGLADTIEDGVTGFLFRDYTSDSFLDGTVRAVQAYNDQPRWAAMQREAMSREFGWKQAERKYLRVYEYAIARQSA